MNQSLISKLTLTLAVVTLSFSLLTGFGFGDLKSKVLPDDDKCEGKKDEDKCKDQEKFKSIVKVAAIGVAAKLIYDMTIEFKSSQISNQDKVIEKYKKQHKTLPASPELTNYVSSLKPGEIVKAGKLVLIQSDLEVVPGKDTKNVDIQEKISIYDNEDHNKLLKTLIKPVNKKSRKSGAYRNEFTFTLPIGMPQGVYPIKTQVLVNNKEFSPVANKMQLVLKIEENSYQILALNN